MFDRFYKRLVYTLLIQTFRQLAEIHGQVNLQFADGLTVVNLWPQR